MLRVGQRVRGVRVHLQGHVAEALAHRTHGAEVPTGLDLELDAPVALVEIAADGAEKVRDRAVDADRHAAVHRRVHRAEELSEGFPFGTQLYVQHRHLDRRLRHAVSVDPAQRARHVMRGRTVALEKGRQQVVDEHMLRRLDIFGRVIGLLARDALPPALAFVGDGLDQKDVALLLRAERRLERGHERHANPPQLDRLQLHAVSVSRPRRASSSSLSSTSAAATFCSSWWTDDAPGITTTFGFLSSHDSATCALVA